jgi:hypothetical protein
MESKAGKLIILNIKYSQIEAGISHPLLENPNIHLMYATLSWSMSVWQFIYQHNCTVTLTDMLQVELRATTATCIINPALFTHYTPVQEKDINLVRLNLQVSNMTTPDGVDVCSAMLQGASDNQDNTSTAKRGQDRKHQRHIKSDCGGSTYPLIAYGMAQSGRIAFSPTM